MKNNIRFDLSDYLIHFFRDVDQMGSNAIEMPEHMGWHSLYEDTRFPAIFMLRAALRNGRLWATWSYRNGIRTVYGPSPAVCFTDMPIGAFVEASQIRHARGEAIGEVALVFPKSYMRTAGALPVIYGISQYPGGWPHGMGGGPRILSADVLPEVEQYRHVSDVSSSGLQIDWTHEREWRWPYRGPQSFFDGLPPSNWFDIGGLDFYLQGILGIGAIVKTRAQAGLVVRDMLAMVDAGIAKEYTFSFVLVTDDLPSVQWIQGRQQLSQALHAATIDLDEFFVRDAATDAQIAAQFAHAVGSVETQAGPDEYGEFGGCWLWLHDATTALARSLLRTGRVFVTAQGRYLARLYEFSDGRSLRQRQEMTQHLAQIIRTNFQCESCYFAVLNSDDPEGVPFYAEVTDDAIPFFNNSWSYA